MDDNKKYDLPSEHTDYPQILQIVCSLDILNIEPKTL